MEMPSPHFHFFARTFAKLQRERGGGFLSSTILPQPRGGDFAMPNWTIIPMLYHEPPDPKVKAILVSADESEENPKYALQDEYGFQKMINKDEFSKHEAKVRLVDDYILSGRRLMWQMRYDEAAKIFNAALKKKLLPCHKETPIELWIQIHRGHALLRAGLLMCSAVEEASTLLKESEMAFSRCLEILQDDFNPCHAFSTGIQFSATVGKAWISFFRGEIETAERHSFRAGILGTSYSISELGRYIDLLFLQVALNRVIGSLEDRERYTKEFGCEFSDVEDIQYVWLLDVDFDLLKSEYNSCLNELIGDDLRPDGDLLRFGKESPLGLKFLQQLRAGYHGNTWLAVGAYPQAGKAYSEALASKSLLLRAAALVGLGNVDSRHSIAKWKASADVNKKIDMERFEDAKRKYEDALEIYDQLGYKEAQIIVHSNLGNLYHERGQPELALEQYKVAMGFCTGKMKISSAARHLHMKFAWLHIEKWNWVGASNAIEEAANIPISRDRLTYARLEHLLGSFHIRKALTTTSEKRKKGEQSNDLCKAKKHLSTAVECFANLVWPLRHFHMTFWLMIFEQQKDTYALLLWCIACQQNNTASTVEALVWSERSRSKVLLAEKWGNFSSRIWNQDWEPGSTVHKALEATASQSFDTIKWEEARENLQILLSNCKLPTGTVIVQYMFCADFGFLIFVLDMSRREPKMKRVTFKEQDLNGEGLDRGMLTALVNGVVSSVSSNPGQAEGNLARDLASLYNLLIKPVEKWIKNSAHIVIIPHEFLVKVPFHALIDGSKRYLIEQYTLSCAESIRNLVQCSFLWDSTSRFLHNQELDNNNGSPSDYTTRKWLVVGVDKHRPVARNLHYAEDEANEVGKLKSKSGEGVKTFLGCRANKEEVLPHFAKADVIHLATHGIINEIYERGGILFAVPDDPEIKEIVMDIVHKEPAYPSTDSPESTRLSSSDDFNEDLRGLEIFKNFGEKFVLSANEILEMDLRAKLVVLSACKSAEGVIMGEGVAGLGRALWLAGVPCTVLSLWQVSDKAAIDFMKQFYTELAGGSSVADAMKATMVTMIKAIKPYSKNKRKYPVGAWAAFMAFGAPVVQLEDLPEEKQYPHGVRSRRSQQLQPLLSKFQYLLDALASMPMPMAAAAATIIILALVFQYWQQDYKFV